MPAPAPVPPTACYYIGGLECAFYIRSTFVEFYELVRLFKKLETDRLAFRRCTWRGDFGGAVAAEIAGDEAATEIAERLATLRMESMEPVPAALAREVIAGRRANVDARFYRRAAQEADPSRTTVYLRQVPGIMGDDPAFMRLMRTATALCKTTPW